MTRVNAQARARIAETLSIGYSKEEMNDRRRRVPCSCMFTEGLVPVLTPVFVPVLVTLLPLLMVACAGGADETRGGESLSATNGLPTTASVSASGETTSTSSTSSTSSISATGTASGSGSESAGTSGTTGLTATETTVSGTGTSSGSTGSSGTTDGPTTSDPTTGGGLCNTELAVTIRDFTSEHPDFESYIGDVAFLGIVQDTLGDDDKPVYAHPGGTSQTSGPDNFLHWYSDTQGINQTFEVAIELTESMPGVFTYDNSEFFPIDGQGFGNEGWPHNYLFTTEIHANFKYEGGEVFTFTGDDDLWTFINGKLAMDLGGLHPPLSKTVDLDALAGPLGIEPGGTYPMDIFHAERHTDQSNFRIDTSIQCFIPQ